MTVNDVLSVLLCQIKDKFNKKTKNVDTKSNKLKTVLNILLL